MIDTDGSGRVTVELWVWSDRDCIVREHDVVIERIERLVADGRIDGFTVEEWDHRPDVSSPNLPDARDERARRRVAAFERWARRHGVALPLPAPRPAGTGRMGPEYVAQDLPRVLLAEYEDGELRSVAPRETAGGTCTIEEGLDELAAGVSRPAPAVAGG
jgi:hypothetical protein